MGGTTFLFAMPAWIAGAARTLDLCGVLARHSYNVSDCAADADTMATWSDWEQIGRDFESAIGRYAEERDAVEAA